MQVCYAFHFPASHCPAPWPVACHCEGHLFAANCSKQAIECRWASSLEAVSAPPRQGCRTDVRLSGRQHPVSAAQTAQAAAAAAVHGQDSRQSGQPEQQQAASQGKAHCWYQQQHNTRKHWPGCGSGFRRRPTYLPRLPPSSAIINNRTPSPWGRQCTHLLLEMKGGGDGKLNSVPPIHTNPTDRRAGASAQSATHRTHCSS